MKKNKLLAGLLLSALLTGISLLVLPKFSEAQEVEGPKAIEKRYRSVDNNANFYCHCRTKGTKCGCVIN